jgi:sugar phosphate isomerase/epimerase
MDFAMTKLRPLCLQLFTVRELVKLDFEGTLRQIAEIGYAGVETVGLPQDISPSDAKQLFDELGLTVIASHADLQLDSTEALDTVLALGSPYAVKGWLSPQEYFSSIEGVERACELLNKLNRSVREAGLTLLYHNHWFEYLPVEGRLPYQIMLEQLDESIGFEVDTYWVKTAGQDPLSVVQEIGTRAPLLHLKDGPAIREQAMTALGDGVMDFPPIIEKAPADWLIVELDRCDTDMMQAVEKSYQYMIAKGLAHGRK